MLLVKFIFVRRFARIISATYYSLPFEPPGSKKQPCLKFEFHLHLPISADHPACNPALLQEKVRSLRLVPNPHLLRADVSGSSHCTCRDPHFWGHRRPTRCPYSPPDVDTSETPVLILHFAHPAWIDDAHLDRQPGPARASLRGHQGRDRQPPIWSQDVLEQWYVGLARLRIGSELYWG